MTTDKLLEIKDLNVGFNSRQGFVDAVKSISFDLFKGEIVGLVGESGSGKSVASMSILRLLDEKQAKISAAKMSFLQKSGASFNILEKNETDLSKIRGIEIGMIFQEPMTSLNPVMRCGDQVAEGMLVHGLETRLSSIQKVYNLFEEVGLPDAKRIYESYPHQLSGGQKQRVMIAMAMACNPSLLIADEPTTALDVTVQKKILEVLKQLCQTKSMAMLFISHDLNLVRELADRILVMYKGEIVEQGTAKLIFENPKHPYTKGLLNCRPPINKKLKVLPTLADFMQSEGKIVYENDAKQIPSDNVIGPEEHEAILKVIESQSPLLSIQNLTTSFTSSGNFFWNPKKKFKAIQEISFNLYKGEVLGLVGESGSGKSTLGRTICRLIDSESGSIMYNGVELSKFFETEFRSYRKKIQIIFQDPYASLNPTMKIGEAILEPMIVHNLNGNRNAQLAKVYELMESVGLPADSYDKYPHEFSGGQRQRISIARALSLEPEILICDECVSALDVNVQAQVLNLLNELKEKYKLSLLFITHDLSVVRFICDRVMVMKSGKLVELGSVEQVLDNPASEYTKLLLESIPK